MRLIVIEGLDGAGKSTQIRLLKDYLEKESYKTEFLHFPRTETPWFGELIARFLRGEFGNLDSVDPYLVAMLYAGDRKDSANLIASWLKEGSMVLLDRYTYSNIAYQCAKLRDPVMQNALKEWILRLEFEHFAIPVPDMNIFLDVPFIFTEKKLTDGRTGEDRGYLNGKKDIHEASLGFQKRVREIYFRVASDDSRLAIVDCSNHEGNMLQPDEIFERIVELLKNKKVI